MLLLDRIAISLLRPASRLISYTGWRGVVLPDDVSVQNSSIPLEGRTLAAKVFQFKSTAASGGGDATSKRPVLLYFHGGGLCQGSMANTHYNCLVMYASQLQCTVVAIDYRLAPEHPFPAGVDDCIDATKWLYAEVQKNKDEASSCIVPSCNGKIIIGGDSAGGLTAIVTGCAVPHLSGAILFYPNTHYDTGEYQSWKDVGGMDHALPATIMNIMFQNLLGMDAKDFVEKHKNKDDNNNAGDDASSSSNMLLLAKAFPLLTPDSAIQANMPPTFLVTCGLDILQDEGTAFKNKLDKLGVKNEHHFYDKEEHGFMCMDSVGANFDDCMSKLKTWFDSQS